MGYSLNISRVLVELSANAVTNYFIGRIGMQIYSPPESISIAEKNSSNFLKRKIGQ